MTFVFGFITFSKLKGVCTPWQIAQKILKKFSLVDFFVANAKIKKYLGVTELVFLLF